MRRFSEMNPIAVAAHIFVTAGIAMFCMDPYVLILAFSGGLFFIFSLVGSRSLLSIAPIAIIALIPAAINPFIVHRGATVLFVINDDPFTLEALIYGACAAFTLAAGLIWLRAFSHIMTGDRLMYLFGALSPKLALVLSMALRYVPLLERQTRRIRNAQLAMGLYPDKSFVGRVKGGVRIFSIMTTWALENGIITADSMAARGYGAKKRTHFSLFRLGARDIVLLAFDAALTALLVIAISLGKFETVYYPLFTHAPASPLSLAAYIAYGALAFIPAIIETEQNLKWKFLRSRI